MSRSNTRQQTTTNNSNTWQGVSNSKYKARNKCKTNEQGIKHDVKKLKKTQVNKAKKPLEFYIPLFLWSPCG
jgi:hypothetical protein